MRAPALRFAGHNGFCVDWEGQADMQKHNWYNFAAEAEAVLTVAPIRCGALFKANQLRRCQTSIHSGVLLGCTLPLFT
jgi:hypothetical protein